MKVFWLHSDKMGCGAYRCYIPALSLESLYGVDSTFMLHEHVVDSALKEIYEIVAESNVVVFQRPVGSIFSDIMKFCRVHNVKTVYEMDDLLFNIPRHNPAFQMWSLKWIQRYFEKHVKEADSLIVSTKPLAEELKQFSGRRDITVGYNHVHPDVWGTRVDDKLSPKQEGEIVIGWQGSITHDVDFKQAIKALVQVVNENPHVSVRFLGSVPLSVKGYLDTGRFTWMKGVPFDQYPAALKWANFDIGLAPVVDSRFNRAKSNVKWLEYSSLGIPTVAADVGPYKSSIKDGETGLLATEKTWYEKIKLLVDSQELRKKIGEQAKTKVWSDWSISCAQSWYKVFSKDQWLTPSQSPIHLVNRNPITDLPG